MKKNISINISGIIFHIEEDGYDQLKKYLDGINSYFSSYQGSEEIIADIESRIAEIFLARLKDGKQVINAEDVQDLIHTMGSIEDFQAVEDPEMNAKTEPVLERDTSDSYYEPTGKKRLYRDNRRKLLGGVAAGLAHFLSMDPLWIRLIFILLFIPFFFHIPVSGFMLLAYLVLWIVMPASDDLSDSKKYKKMFRNPDDKVLGGVAGGIASFFGIDVVVVRLLFVISIFFAGTGILLYIILWIILPEAKTITEKIEMQGEPVTLSNIESSIKKSLHVEDQEENLAVKILLFPFRLLAALLEIFSTTLGPILRFLVDIIRIFAGALMILVAVGGIVVSIALVAAMLGLLIDPQVIQVFSEEFPIEMLRNSIPSWTSISFFFTMLIPFILLIILGLTVINRKKLIRPMVGWSLFALWVVSVLVFSLSITPVIADFATTGQFEEKINYAPDAGTVVLKLDEKQGQFDAVSLQLRGHEDSLFTLVKTFEARGKNPEDGASNAAMLEYSVVLNDSVFIFPASAQFKPGAEFRDQRLEMTMYIPYRQEFVMDNNLRKILRNTLYRYGYNSYLLEESRWLFNENGLECINCEQDKDTKEDLVEKMNIGKFNSIETGDNFRIKIIRQPDYSIRLNANKELSEHINFKNSAETLSIYYDNSVQSDEAKNHEVEIVIGMPELDKITCGGGAQLELSGFDQDRLEIHLNDAASAELKANVANLDVTLDGVSNLVLKGKGNGLKCIVASAANLDALNYTLKNAEVEANGAPQVHLNVSEKLEVDASGKSEIHYKGNPEIKSQLSVSSSLKKLNS